MKRSIFAVLALVAALFLAVPTQEASAGTNNTCPTTGATTFAWQAVVKRTSTTVWCLRGTSATGGHRLVWYGGRLQVWSTPNTGGTLLWQSPAGSVLTFQTDGNVVIYTGLFDDRAVWSMGWHQSPTDHQWYMGLNAYVLTVHWRTCTSVGCTAWNTGVNVAY